MAIRSASKPGGIRSSTVNTKPPAASGTLIDDVEFPHLRRWRSIQRGQQFPRTFGQIEHLIGLLGATHHHTVETGVSGPR